MWSLMSYLYILDINLLSDTSFPSMFSLSGSSLFTLLIVSFTGQKFLVWCGLFDYFCFYFPCQKRQLQKNIAKVNVKEFKYCLCFLLEVLWFQVLHLSLGSILNLSLYMVWDSRWHDTIHCCCCSVVKLCLTLCNSMDCSLPGFPVLH